MLLVVSWIFEFSASESSIWGDFGDVRGFAVASENRLITCNINNLVPVCQS